MQANGATKQRTDPSQAAGSTWLPMPLCPWRPATSPPCSAETRARAGSHRFIFKDDRVGPQRTLRKGRHNHGQEQRRGGRMLR